MKKLSLLLSIVILVISFFFMSCEKTNKQSNKTGDRDTIVVKKDTAIKKTDTAGYNK
ncbi:MAG: hypothetical protein ABI840_00930 [bacterium]